MYGLKWIGTEKPELISAEEANIMCPQTLTKFFEETVSWD